ncbi:hypothetical protein AAZX31_06G283600 [Glycine max]|uniref:Uncharacterized protein n=1 Tax=Glycine max TaxID=3847 RepID=A0A0R0JN53_SOYBN|nr:hypothetical protein JHK85_017336 [Glycine max]KAG5047559.1 hypothetical protein JHK86_016965 [Glycine max]KAG5150037.1 hypothetical protein JHK82_016918 [Glycine max]KAH1128249.1 hypothetical protein GYH30_016705 [Glycine max]
MFFSTTLGVATPPCTTSPPQLVRKTPNPSPSCCCLYNFVQDFFPFPCFLFTIKDLSHLLLFFVLQFKICSPSPCFFLLLIQDQFSHIRSPLFSTVFFLLLW